MFSEAPSGATAACPAANLVWVAADFDRPCERRLRGWRSGLRPGLFVLAALFACLLVCSLAIVFVLGSAPRLSRCYTTASPALGARRGSDQEGAVDMDSNASFAGEVERNVSRQRFFAALQASSNKTGAHAPVGRHCARH